MASQGAAGLGRCRSVTILPGHEPLKPLTDLDGYRFICEVSSIGKANQTCTDLDISLTYFVWRAGRPQSKCDRSFSASGCQSGR